jgi:hypothetical protein
MDGGCTMAKLTYFMPTSLDGYIADETGNPDWAAPDVCVNLDLLDERRFANGMVYLRYHTRGYHTRA